MAPPLRPTVMPLLARKLSELVNAPVMAVDGRLGGGVADVGGFGQLGS